MMRTARKRTSPEIMCWYASLTFERGNFSIWHSTPESLAKLTCEEKGAFRMRRRAREGGDERSLRSLGQYRKAIP